MENKRIAVIRIRGETGLSKPLRDTLKMLRLYKKHNCVVISNTPVYIGMLEKVKESTTWGEISEEACKLLFEKRGRVANKQPLTEEYLKKQANLTFESFTKEFMTFKKEIKDVPGLKPFFKLLPPRQGFESKGIKIQYSLGGALGYRKDKINDLLKRML
ncbi:MAG: 50S ribosomal protein L30 [Candidatus Woesearchaeota archaeon]|nr:50S ribosomal protein L30 [Candidatus Woesearchaeota archaeon]